MSGAYLLFDLATSGEGATFALGVAHVHQVTEATHLVPVPLAPPPVEGVLNHNGRIFTVVDPAPLLGLPPQPRAVAQVITVRRGASASHVALKVLRARAIVSADELVGHESSRLPCVQASYRSGEERVHVVDVPLLIASLLACFDAAVPSSTASHRG